MFTDYNQNVRSDEVIRTYKNADKPHSLHT
jgi:hypothetical protein